MREKKVFFVRFAAAGGKMVVMVMVSMEYSSIATGLLLQRVLAAKLACLSCADELAQVKYHKWLA